MKYSLTVGLIILYLNSFSQPPQFSFRQLVKYLHMPYDTLDEVLSKKGLHFKETSNIREGSTVASWINGKGLYFGVISTPDTVTLRNNNIYVGYTDVNKKGVCLQFLGKVQYDLLNSYLKLHFTKNSIQTEGDYLIIMYNNDQYIITLKKTIVDNDLYGFIEIDDLAYEIGEQHYQFQ